MATRTITKRKLTDKPELLLHLVPLSPAELHSKIAARAYEIYLARNGSAGDETHDWLMAEHEISGLNTSPTPFTDNSATTRRKSASTPKSTTPRSSKSKTTSRTQPRKPKQTEE